jgi:hypothetical protein
MLERNIVMYCVGCEPALSQSQFGRDFFAGIAKITEGQFLPLSSANLLADVVIGGAKEEMALNRLMESLKVEVDQLQAEKVKSGKAPLSTEEVTAEITKRYQDRGVKTKQVTVDNVYGSWDQRNVNAIYAGESLACVAKSFKPVSVSVSVNAPVSSSSISTAPRSYISRSSAMDAPVELTKSSKKAKPPSPVASAKPGLFASLFGKSSTKSEPKAVVLESEAKSVSKSYDEAPCEKDMAPSMMFTSEISAAPSSRSDVDEMSSVITAPSSSLAMPSSVAISQPVQQQEQQQQQVYQKTETVSYSQVSRMMNRYAAQSKAKSS